jgi:integrase/recombinase XerC
VEGAGKESERILLFTRYQRTGGLGSAKTDRGSYLKNRRKGIQRPGNVLLLLYDLALRRAEVVSLDLEDVDLEAGTLQVLGKGRLQKETLSIPTSTITLLADWHSVRGDWAGPLFINLRHDPRIQGKRISTTSLCRIIRDLGRKTEQMVRPHGLRHPVISAAGRRAYAVGMDVTKVLQFSRHKDLKTLRVYIDQVAMPKAR